MKSLLSSGFEQYNAFDDVDSLQRSRRAMTAFSVTSMGGETYQVRQNRVCQIRLDQDENLQMGRVKVKNDQTPFKFHSDGTVFFP